MDQEFTRWQAGGLPLSIEYSPAVMEELRVYGEEGFQKIPHGGIEVGAILLGDRDEQTVRIREWRPLACDHARGPGFVLSAADHEALTRQIEACATAPELAGLSVVGWFHTHTRSRIFLSPEDLAIHEAHFAEPWQVALVMRPQKDQAPTAGFFSRDAGGALNGEACAEEFTVRPDPLQSMQPRRSSAAPPLTGGVVSGGLGGRIMSGRPEGVSRGPESVVRHERQMFRHVGDGRAAAAAAGAQAEGGFESSQVPSETGALVASAGLLAPPRPQRQPRGLPSPDFDPSWAAGGELVPVQAAAIRSARAAWLVAGLVAAVALVTGVQLWRVSHATPVAQLNVEEADQSLQISWDKSAVASADRAVLRLVDGTTVRSVPLSQTAVRHGSVTYLRQADDVEVRLTLYRGNQAGEQMFARYVGAPRDAVTAGQYADDGGGQALASAGLPSEQRLRLQSDVARLRQALQAEADRTDRLREELVLLEKTSGGARRR